MKIFLSEKIKELDGSTILREPIASVDLMERAASELLKWYMETFDRTHRVIIFCGTGNNGGDGLALARMLSDNRYQAEIYYIAISENTTGDWEINRRRIEIDTTVPFRTISGIEEFPDIRENDVIIDAIFGSGLTRPAEGLASEIIKHINLCDSTVVSVDIPSGLFGEDNRNNDHKSIINADYTICFQFPRLSFLFPENEQYVGTWVIKPIGLDPVAISNMESPYLLLENHLVAPLIKPRRKFDHKGKYGHGILIGGSYGKIGAVVLGAKAALRTGLGLITCHIPNCGNPVVQGAVPEAMVIDDLSEKYISDIGNTNFYDAVGVGPGMGTDPESDAALHHLLKNCKKPMVIDADALNIIGAYKKWFSILPEGTILTPHPKEFERLAGRADDSYERLMMQIEFSKMHKCIVVLKGAHTSISTPDGKVRFNNTGNPGMATAGSGDVLTGIILSLLAQGYSPENAAILGVYLHGVAGDVAAGESCFESIIASDIINCIGKAFNYIRLNGTRA
jgi:NAD(P)H-hydrate epimerase